MAKIWPVYEGTVPTRDRPWANLPLAEAIDLFELQQKDFASDFETPPRFGSQERDLWFAGFKHVVIEADAHETRGTQWKSGFYKSKIKPREALAKLIRHALAPSLGAENIVRVDWEPTTDSQGSDALSVVVVVTPEATRQLTGATVLDASMALRRTLPNIFGEHVPIVEYMTVAESNQRVGA